MKFDPNSLFYVMLKTYVDNKTDDNKVIFCNEGGARSSKTFDAIHLIYKFCSDNRNLKIPLRIGCFRDTLKDSREKLYYDFKTCLKEMDVYDPNSAYKENQSPEYFLYGNKIEFRGLDEDTEQVSYDIVFVNEAMEIDNEAKISGLKMRCTKLMIFDWNPKYTQHWIFDWEGRPDIYFTKTTYKNNKHLKPSIVAEIESKSPWNLDDLHLPEGDRRPNTENIKNRTADEWYFKVYGMGDRANRDGLVFPSVTWIDEFPKDVERVFYGNDFGFTIDPNCLVKCGVNGNKLYAEIKCYTPIDNINTLSQVLKPIVKDDIVWCDSADRYSFIPDLRLLGISAYPAKKYPGCIKYRISVIKRYDLYIVYSKEAKIEQENYSYRVIHGIQIEEPIDKFNHFWDALGYAVQHELRHELDGM